MNLTQAGDAVSNTNLVSDFPTAKELADAARDAMVAISEDFEGGESSVALFKGFLAQVNRSLLIYAHPYTAAAESSLCDGDAGEEARSSKASLLVDDLFFRSILNADVDETEDEGILGDRWVFCSKVRSLAMDAVYYPEKIYLNNHG